MVFAKKRIAVVTSGRSRVSYLSLRNFKYVLLSIQNEVDLWDLPASLYSGVTFSRVRRIQYQICPTLEELCLISRPTNGR